MSSRTREYIRLAHFYAEADRSDPFVLDRAMAHIRSGVVGLVERGRDIVSAHYSATPVVEERSLQDGEKYFVTVYTNRVRP